jgi:CubicO group peptidase (beta-lactamase class C family)
MRLLPSVLVCLLTCVPPAAAQRLSAPEAVGLSSTRLERARAVLRTAIDRKVAGSAVGLIARDGKVVFLEAFGEMEPGVPMTTNAISRAASITKTVTAVAVLMLYEEGRLRLSDSAFRFIPEFKSVQVERAGNAAGSNTLVAADRPVTIQDLLTHQAGLAPDGPAVDQLWDRAQTVGEFAQGIARIPLRFQPGTQWEYGSMGSAYEVLAAVVEKASGMRFDEFLQKRIFSPLRMEDTTFYVPQEKRDRYAGIYQSDSSGQLSMYRRRGQEEAPTRFFSGGGGLRTTAYDYYRFAQMLLNWGELDGQRLLSPKTVELMTTDHVGAHRTGDDGWGLGASVRTRVFDGGIGSVGSYGWNGGTGTMYLVDPRERLIVVVFVPSQPGTPGVWELRNDFVTAAYQSIVELHQP